MAYGQSGLPGTALLGAEQAFRGGQGPASALNLDRITARLVGRQVSGALSRSLRRRGLDANNPRYAGLRTEAMRTDAANQAGALSQNAAAEYNARLAEFGRIMGSGGVRPDLAATTEGFSPAEPTPVPQPAAIPPIPAVAPPVAPVAATPVQGVGRTADVAARDYRLRYPQVAGYGSGYSNARFRNAAML